MYDIVCTFCAYAQKIIENMYTIKYNMCLLDNIGNICIIVSAFGIVAFTFIKAIKISIRKDK